MAEETAAVTTRQRRKRKWDQPAESVVSTTVGVPGFLPFGSAISGMGTLPGMFPLMGVFPSISTPLSSSAPQYSHGGTSVQQNAVAIVQKLNQDIASKVLFPQGKIQDELIAREIVINDAESGIRYKLTKRQTQEEIQIKTGAVVITRGRYRPPNGPVEPEKPLYLHISAGIQLKDTAERIKAVDQAAAMVEEMLKQGRQGLQGSTTVANSNGTLLTVNVYVGFEADPSFNLVGRIHGPNDQYINHIMNETGATVMLRGRGSGKQEGASSEAELLKPLYLQISSDNSKSLDDAKRLAENLLETIRSDSLALRPPLHQPSPGTTSHGCILPSVSYSVPPSVPYNASTYASASIPQAPCGGFYPNGATYSSPYLPCQSTVAPISSSQPSGTEKIPVNPYANMLPQIKVYGAVPPPVQLCGNQSTQKNLEHGENSPAVDKLQPESSVNDLTSSTFEAVAASSTIPHSSSSSVTSFVHTSNSYPTYPPTSTTYGAHAQQFLQFATVPPHSSLSTVTSQSGQSNNLGKTVFSSYSGNFRQPSLPSPPLVTSYAGYGGVYPQASPLQQVAQALQRPPLPVSVKPGSTSLLPSALKVQASSIQDKQQEKQTPLPQRRKFQEFPVAAKEASEDEQQQLQEGRGPSRLDGSSLSLTNMPPPNFTHQMFTTALPSMQSLPSTKPSASLAESKEPDESGVKLVEYGEEDEESGHASSQSRPITPPSFANGKPFWAV